MELLYNRIYWCDIADPLEPQKSIRIFGDRLGKKLYIEQGSNTLEIDVPCQAHLASFLTGKIALEVSESIYKPKDITKNI